ncbi:MAG: hypothetical protein ACK42K_07645, partial [Leptonema sp. (in: bacteria)]
MKKQMRYLITIIACASIGFGATASESRSWTSKDGSATVDGKLFRQSADEITIVLPNGRSQTIKRDLLSDADNAWLDENESSPGVEPGGSGAAASAKIPSALEGLLVNDRGDPVSVVSDG